MGLADILNDFSKTGLAAGLGQGLASGVQSYNQGTEQQQQMALRKQEADRQMRLFAMQQQQHDFDQNLKRNALVQHDMQGALARGDNQAAAGYMGDLNTARQGMGLAALPMVVGTPVPGIPEQKATPMGPQWSGEAMGLAARPAVPAHNDFGGERTFNALASAADYTVPEPKLQSFNEGALVAHWDPRQHKMVQDFQVPTPTKTAALQQQLDIANMRNQTQRYLGDGRLDLGYSGIESREGIAARSEAGKNQRQAKGYDYQRALKDIPYRRERQQAGQAAANQLVKEFPELSITAQGERDYATAKRLWDGSGHNPKYASPPDEVNHVATGDHGVGMAIDMGIPRMLSPERERQIEQRARQLGLAPYWERNSPNGPNVHMTITEGVAPLSRAGRETNQTVMNYSPDGKTATVVPKTPGTVVNTRPAAAKAPRPFNANAFQRQWRTESKGDASFPLSTQDRAEMAKATQRAKAAWDAEQNGKPDATQQLVDMMRQERAARGQK